MEHTLEVRYAACETRIVVYAWNRHSLRSQCALCSRNESWQAFKFHQPTVPIITM